MTRAFVALAHGDWRTALDFNIASPGVFIAAACLLLLATAQALTDRPLLERAWGAVRKPLFPATVALMAAAWSVNLARCFR